MSPKRTPCPLYKLKMYDFNKSGFQWTVGLDHWNSLGHLKKKNEADRSLKTGARGQDKNSFQKNNQNPRHKKWSNQIVEYGERDSNN